MAGPATKLPTPLGTDELMSDLMRQIVDASSGPGEGKDLGTELEGCSCVALYAPVCRTATKTTFTNQCKARCDGVDPSELTEGAC